MERLDQAAAGLHDGVTKDPADSIRARVQELKTHADDLYEAINLGDVKQAAKAAQHLAKTGANLAELLRKEAAKTSDPTLKAELEAAAKAIEKLVADAVAATKTALGNPSSPTAKTALKEKVDDLKLAADHAGDLLQSEIWDEKTLRDTAKSIEETMNKLQSNARKGDRKAVEENLTQLNNNAKRYLKVAEKRNFHNPGAEDPMAELRRLWNTIGHPAREVRTDGVVVFCFPHLNNYIFLSTSWLVNQMAAMLLSTTTSCQTLLRKYQMA